jgi:hypothetical protein
LILHLLGSVMHSSPTLNSEYNPPASDNLQPVQTRSRRVKQDLEAEAAEYAAQYRVKKAAAPALADEVPHCSCCLSTLGVRIEGTCMRCQSKYTRRAPSLAASYGPSPTPKTANNDIY